jgi:DNA repair protein SbcC/Rad50
MIIDRLELENFKRFRKADIRFKDGITGILGNNGTGKSSLVTAIFFALYGVRATGIYGDYIVSSFAAPKEKCKVRLDFRISGDEYSILRTFRRSGKLTDHDASFFHNGKERANGVTQVEAEVKRTLGMGPVDFRNTIYAAQKDLLVLMNASGPERKMWFLKALGIDYLKTESDIVLKKQIDDKIGNLRSNEGELKALAGQQSEEDLAHLQASVTKFHAVIMEHEKAREFRKKERAGLDGKLKVLAEKKLAYNRLLQQHQNLTRERDTDTLAAKNLEATIALLAEEDAEYHRIEKTAGSYEEVTRRLNAMREKKSEYLRIHAELGFATKEIADLNARAGKQRDLIKALDADEQKKAGFIQQIQAGLGAGDIAEDRLESAVSYRLAEINKQSGILTTRLAHYQEEREKIAADQKTIREAGADGICPLCQQKLGNHFGSIEDEFNARLQDLEGKAVAELERQEKLAKEKTGIERLKPVLDMLRTLMEKLRQKPVYEEELAGLEAKQKTKAGEQKALTESLARLGYDEKVFQALERESAELQKVQLRFIDLGKKIGQAQMVKEQLAGITTKIAGRNAELAKLDSEIKTAAFDPYEAEKLEAAVAETDAALRNEEVFITSATKDLCFTKEKIAEYKRAREQIVALQKQTGELSDEIELLKLTRTLIAEYVVYLMQVVRSRLEGEVSRIISEITGGRYEQVLLDEDFNLLIRDVDDDYAIDRFSGGEQDDIAVALRIALSRYLAELHQVHESTFLIFDEIFGSQDEERRSNLLTALRTQESRFPQILLISHIAEMQGEFANTLVIEMGADGSSRVKEVE